ncbi:hypothetical protein L7F22_064753 [Adiantum nelumboides]|nr:hypothetical protein [Adiantum nelumboides]
MSRSKMDPWSSSSHRDFAITGLGHGLIFPQKSIFHYRFFKNKSTLEDLCTEKCTNDLPAFIRVLVGTKRALQEWLKSAGPGSCSLWTVIAEEDVDLSKPYAPNRLFKGQLHMVYRLRSVTPLILPVFPGTHLILSPQVSQDEESLQFKKKRQETLLVANGIACGRRRRKSFSSLLASTTWETISVKWNLWNTSDQEHGSHRITLLDAVYNEGGFSESKFANVFKQDFGFLIGVQEQSISLGGSGVQELQSHNLTGSPLLSSKERCALSNLGSSSRTARQRGIYILLDIFLGEMKGNPNRALTDSRRESLNGKGVSTPLSGSSVSSAINGSTSSGGDLSSNESSRTLSGSEKGEVNKVTDLNKKQRKVNPSLQTDTTHSKEILSHVQDFRPEFSNMQVEGDIQRLSVSCDHTQSREADGFEFSQLFEVFCKRLDTLDGKFGHSEISCKLKAVQMKLLDWVQGGFLEVLIEEAVCSHSKALSRKETVLSVEETADICLKTMSALPADSTARIVSSMMIWLKDCSVEKDIFNCIFEDSRLKLKENWTDASGESFSRNNMIQTFGGELEKLWCSTKLLLLLIRGSTFIALLVSEIGCVTMSDTLPGGVLEQKRTCIKVPPFSLSFFTGLRDQGAENSCTPRSVPYSGDQNALNEKPCIKERENCKVLASKFVRKVGHALLLVFLCRGERLSGVFRSKPKSSSKGLNSDMSDASEKARSEEPHCINDSESRTTVLSPLEKLVSSHEIRPKVLRLMLRPCLSEARGRACNQTENFFWTVDTLSTSSSVKSSSKTLQNCRAMILEAKVYLLESYIALLLHTSAAAVLAQHDLVLKLPTDIHTVVSVFMVDLFSCLRSFPQSDAKKLQDLIFEVMYRLDRLSAQDVAKCSNFELNDSTQRGAGYESPLATGTSSMMINKAFLGEAWESLRVMFSSSSSLPQDSNYAGPEEGNSNCLASQTWQSITTLLCMLAEYHRMASQERISLMTGSHDADVSASCKLNSGKFSTTSMSDLGSSTRILMEKKPLATQTSRRIKSWRWQTSNGFKIGNGSTNGMDSEGIVNQRSSSAEFSDHFLSSRHERLQCLCKTCATELTAQSLSLRISMLIEQKSLDLLAQVFRLKFTSDIPTKILHEGKQAELLYNPFSSKRYVYAFLDFHFLSFLQLYNWKTDGQQRKTFQQHAVPNLVDCTYLVSEEEVSTNLDAFDTSQNGSANAFPSLLSDEETINLACQKHGEVRLSLAQNQSGDVSRRFKELRVMDFLMHQITLEYELSHVATPRELIGGRVSSNPLVTQTQHLHDFAVSKRKSNEKPMGGGSPMSRERREDFTLTCNTRSTDKSRQMVDVTTPGRQKRRSRKILHDMPGIDPDSARLLESVNLIHKNPCLQHHLLTCISILQRPVNQHGSFTCRAGADTFRHKFPLSAKDKVFQADVDKNHHPLSLRRQEFINFYFGTPAVTSHSLKLNSIRKKIVSRHPPRVYENSSFLFNDESFESTEKLNPSKDSLEASSNITSNLKESKSRISNPPVVIQNKVTSNRGFVYSGRFCDLNEEVENELEKEDAELHLELDTKCALLNEDAENHASKRDKMFLEALSDCAKQQRQKTIGAIRPLVPKLNLPKSARKGDEPEKPVEVHVSRFFSPKRETREGQRSKDCSDLDEPVLEADNSAGGNKVIELSYERQRMKRRIYQDCKLHVLLLELFVSLMITPEGSLETCDTDRFPMDGQKMNAPFYLLYPSNLHSNNDTKRRCNSVVLKTVDLPKGPHEPCKFFDIYSEVEILEKFTGDPRVCQLLDYGVDIESFILALKHYKCSLRYWRQHQKLQYELAKITCRRS